MPKAFSPSFTLSHVSLVGGFLLTFPLLVFYFQKSSLVMNLLGWWGVQSNREVGPCLQPLVKPEWLWQGSGCLPHRHQKKKKKKISHLSPLALPPYFMCRNQLVCMECQQPPSCCCPPHHALTQYCSVGPWENHHPCIHQTQSPPATLSTSWQV